LRPQYESVWASINIITYISLSHTHSLFISLSFNFNLLF
jgi:hypothetical protein